MEILKFSEKKIKEAMKKNQNGNFRKEKNTKKKTKQKTTEIKN